MHAYEGAAFDATEESTMAARTYARLLDAIPAQTRSAGALVDIGAGDGAFLVAAGDRGFAARVGFEPSAAPVAAATFEARPLLRAEPLTSDALPAASASVVTCFQTIEHVDAPLELCRMVADLLRPDGALLIVCHDADALSAKLLGTRSPIFDIEHLQLFSRPSLRELVHRAGFRRMRVRPLMNAYPLGYWARLAPVPGKPAVLKALATTGLGRVTIPLLAGNLVVTAWR
jgi:SAM-dependent methyltransferase